MYYIKQDDFNDFKCIAGECPQSCCIGWQIVIDEDTIGKYERYKGNFRDRIDHGIDFEEGVFLQNKRRCTMLREDGLCDLQVNMGEEKLCYTCKTYPRHVEEYEDVREYSLSLSCPEVARMELEREDPIEFVEYEDDIEDDFEDFDYMLYTKLEDARQKLYEIAKNREYSMEYRLKKILEISKKLQQCMDEDRLFDMDEVIEAIAIKDVPEYEIEEDMSILFQLELLDDNWLKVIKSSKEAKLSEMTNREEIATENILVLLIYTYFCGAVYDDEIFSKAGLIVYSVIWIYFIYKSTLKEDENIKYLQEITYKYAREVEHSDINLNKLEEYFRNIM